MEMHKFRDETLDIEERLDDLMSQLTLQEKFQLSFGKTMFRARGVKRLNINPFPVTDGPVGVAFHSSLKRNTYFPATIGLAATWNTDLCHAFGEAIAKETRATGNNMILGPGINICRTPLNGRTFEYLGEDPYQNSKLVVPIVKGIQEQGIASCVKHYAANNQEVKRFKVSAEVSKRALEEIYLPAFKAAITEADAWSVMACYNKVNGIYGAENKALMVERLKNQWGFRGFVVSDWFAARATSSVGACVEGGLALDMPGKVPPIPSMTYQFDPKRMQKAYDNGEFSEEALDRNLRGYLRVQMLTGAFDKKENRPKGERNTQAHRDVARKIAEESMVLLKNDNQTLPLDINKIKTIALLGVNKNKRMAYVGYGGSSAVWPEYEITPQKGLQEKSDEQKQQGKDGFKIIKDPVKADVAIVVAGLSHAIGQDSENFDRKYLTLNKKQETLIQETAKQNPNTIVVLVNGSPLAMDNWLSEVPAVLEAWYGGMEGGRALADILFGEVNPSGKLPVTFPKTLADSPAHKNKDTYPGGDKVYYEEGIYVGYRHFDKNKIAPLFPFGFGLSYTTFAYSNLQTDKTELNSQNPDDKITVTVDVTNTGDRQGKEIVQLYLSFDQTSPDSIDRPVKELKGFAKVDLKPGETKSVAFEISPQDCMYFDEERDDWVCELGDVKVEVSKKTVDRSTVAGDFHLI